MYVVVLVPRAHNIIQQQQQMCKTENRTTAWCGEESISKLICIRFALHDCSRVVERGNRVEPNSDIEALQSREATGCFTVEIRPLEDLSIYSGKCTPAQTAVIQSKKNFKLHEENKRNTSSEPLESREHWQNTVCSFLWILKPHNG